jgi:nitrogen fixation NifU-like protein|uniref:Fe-S cluster assembly scaffold protein NifU n=1 Tax=Desulfobacca acetoxidans TaxID=60893 RepID=A0A7C5AKK2_9BACT
MYSPIVMDHFKNPRNVGEIPDADGVGEVGNPVCGDMMNVYIKVENDRIADIKFKTFGCGAAIAVSSMITELAKGKTLEEAMKITNRDVAEALGGLPQNKLHCSNLGADALHSAIKNYLDRKAGRIPDLNRDREGHIKGSGEGGCYCPYCHKKAEEEAPFCLFCGAEIPHEHDH